MISHSKLSFDRTLILTVLLLYCFGLVMVTSASIAVAEKQTGNAMFYFIKQGSFGLISLGLCVMMLFTPTQKLFKIGAYWLFISLFLLTLVLIPGIGHIVNGSRRWLKFGPLAIQVTEMVKLFGVLYISQYLIHHGQECREELRGILKPIAMLGLIIGLMLLEPDFGASVVLFTTALGIMFMAGVRLRWFSILMGMAAFAMILLVLISPYRLARLTGFLHPWVNQYGSGYQLTQSLIAFGRGGFFGVGLGNSLQKLFYLPEAHTDFILAIIAEEFGLLGILSLMSLFGILIWRGLAIAKEAHLQELLFDAYVAYGISFWMGLQVIVNIGVNIGLLPTKGLTLPFISYGGSSLMVNFVVMGILLRIDYQNKLSQSTF